MGLLGQGRELHSMLRKQWSNEPVDLTQEQKCADLLASRHRIPVFAPGQKQAFAAADIHRRVWVASYGPIAAPRMAGIGAQLTVTRHLMNAKVCP
jgi:hypothetical protein